MAKNEGCNKDGLGDKILPGYRPTAFREKVFPRTSLPFRMKVNASPSSRLSARLIATDTTLSLPLGLVPFHSAATMAANLQSVAQLLDATLDPKQNKQGMSFPEVQS